MWLDTMNEQLNVWPLYTDSVEEWLMKHTKEAQRLTNELKTLVKVDREKLSRQF